MRILLKNHHLVTLIPFLQGMKLKGERSRARSKFLTLALEAYNALHESETELLKDYAELDGKGDPVTAEDGGFILKRESAKECLAEREKLFNEVAEIEGGTYWGHFAMMRKILSEYDEELDGDNAALYDALCDAFEESEASHAR